MSASSGTICIEIDELHGKWAAALHMLLKAVQSGKVLSTFTLLWRGEEVDVTPIMTNMRILNRPEYDFGFDIAMLARVPRDWTGAGCLELKGDRFRVNEWLENEPLQNRTQTIEVRTTHQHHTHDPKNLSSKLFMATIVLFESPDDLVYMKMKYS